MTDNYHIPVLLKESVDGLNIRPDGVYIDATFGGGGHSREILSRLGSKGHLFSFDQDADAQANALHDDRFTFVRSNFRYLKNWMRYYEIEAVDGVLADLGVSSHHLDDEARGFSFRFDAPLDMRMNTQAPLTAAQLVNNADEQHLADVIYLYGELKQARRIAAAIVKARQQKAIATTGDLTAVVERFLPPQRAKKDMAKLYQALRIEVNQEMAALREMLTQAIDLMAEGGRLSVITYHSLEDRMVKNFIKAGNAEGRPEQDSIYGQCNTPLKAINNKVVVATDEEIEQNPRSRSAKLRIAEKK